MRTGLQGLNYSRLEVVLDEVSNGHEYFTDYKVTIFPHVDNYVIRADTESCDDRIVAIDIFQQVQEELTQKYGLASGISENEGFDIEFYVETDMNPMANWLFDPLLDNEVRLFWIMLRVVQHEVSGWTVSLSYTYQKDDGQNNGATSL